MFKQIRSSKLSKILSSYIAIMIFLQVTQPIQIYALTSGPSQPEFNSFTPIGTSDMVNLSSGDFNYNIPIMDVGGYPINLSYDSGITMDQEASWVGLGWNLNVGQISRQVRGLPDDFRGGETGDVMNYQDDVKLNKTVGANLNIQPAIFGAEPISIGIGVGAAYNNYDGMTYTSSVSASYKISDNVQVGVSLSGSDTEGASVNPSVSLSSKKSGFDNFGLSLSGGFHSRKGLETMTISGSGKFRDEKGRSHSTSLGQGTLSFNTQSYTPTQRIGFINKNETYDASVGVTVFGVDVDLQVTGYGVTQEIHPYYKNRNIFAYGYDYTNHKNTVMGSVMDFNREKESVFNKHTAALPVTSYTYDIYNIEGQGVGGMFRPHHSQVGVVYNDIVYDGSLSGSFGGEAGTANTVHVGADFKGTYSTTSTGPWLHNNHTLLNFSESNLDKNKPLYESVNYKIVGELNVDQDAAYHGQLNEQSPMRLAIDGMYYNRSLKPAYNSKFYTTGGSPSYAPKQLSGKIKRTQRQQRNQTVQKITVEEAKGKSVVNKPWSGIDPFIYSSNTNAKKHHTAGIKVIQPNGTTYVYGRAVYNTKKVEATFDVSLHQGDPVKGLVRYTPGGVNSAPGSDQYKSIITTPGYAHSYLITSILSSDYEDIDNNGPSDSDLGSYTKFNYETTAPNYKWRTPYEENKASYNEGFNSSNRDQRGSYIYGEKELTYVRTIETKTHVAYFEFEDRKDALPVLAENGGKDTSISSRMKCIKTIKLYSKPELIQAGAYFPTSNEPILVNLSKVQPIKTAHFKYNYSLCSNAISSEGTSGKLTLEKVYFTYRGSNMGKYTPYVFTYKNNNPLYDMRGFDVWGNYKENTTSSAELNNAEYPFVEQNKTKADINTSAWVLEKITLPSGGEIKITTESDDYQYVQNRKAMQMFKVIGAGNLESGIPQRGSLPTMNNLYLGGNHSKYLYVDLGENKDMTTKEFRENYLSENLNKPIYFKFKVNITQNPSDYDYVEGYFMIKDELTNTPLDLVSSQGVAAIPVQFVDREKSTKFVNPIAKAGWGFARTYLSKIAFNKGEKDVENISFANMAEGLTKSISSMGEMFKGPNKLLEQLGCASKFDAKKSWIRLENPDGHKLGGGLRVKKVEMSDNWDVMNGLRPEGGTNVNTQYEEFYGQEYRYELEDQKKTSSGVATFEPNGSKENPFVEPLFGTSGSYLERLASPKDQNYVELPLGENFFPAPTVTYSRVTVSNLKREEGIQRVKKHATGTVVTEHYTSKDFPTKADFTNLDKKDDSPNFNLFLKSTRKHLTATQGFSIITNDMNGKEKSTSVYQEEDLNKKAKQTPISRVEYNYHVDSKGNLDNNLITIDSKGKVERKQVGIDIDVINDINESKSVTRSAGVDTNLAMFMVAIFPAFIPVPIPSFSRHETQLRTATTTKVVHQTGVLKEKTAYDLGSKVSTENLAWDAKSGQVLLTKTINEFDDHYYNISYPAYWAYENMGLASDNIGLSGYLVSNPTGDKSQYTISDLTETSTYNISDYFKKGDELIVFRNELQGQKVVVTDVNKYWVSDYSDDKKHIQLIDINGKKADDYLVLTPSKNNQFRVTRSGNRNQQTQTMASITTTVNPIDQNNDKALENITAATFTYGSNVNQMKVINASAVVYSGDWAGVCEGGLDFKNTTYNPYRFNIKGDWRAVKSYAYLSGRVASNNTTVDRRTAGYFTDFNPFYQLENNQWVVKEDKWTPASEVTKYSPYGVELENKDALDRYSSAQYGYNYTLPTAVSSNAKYEEMGFDNFENLLYNNINPHFGFTNGITTDGPISITPEAAHTGNKSLKVKAGNKVSFKRKIDGCVYDPAPTTTN